MSSKHEPEMKKDLNDTHSNFDKGAKESQVTIQRAIETAADAAMESAIGSLIGSAMKSFFGSSTNSASNSSLGKTEEKNEAIECEKLKDTLIKCLQTNFIECADLQKEFKDCIVKHSISSK